MTKEEVIDKIKENKTVLNDRNINGYTVKTVFNQKHKDGEVFVKVIVVYDGDKIVQISVDAENLFGTLLETKAFRVNCTAENFAEQDFSEIANYVLWYLKI